MPRVTAGVGPTASPPQEARLVLAYFTQEI